MIRLRPNRIVPLSPAGGQEWRTGGRVGAIALEFLLVFPIVFLATLAIFQFGLLALILQCATSALIEGARTGAAYYPPSTSNADIADQVAARVNQFLAVHGLSVGGSGTVEILMERGTNPSVTRGALPSGFTMGPASGPPPSSSEIRLTLCFPISYIANPTTDRGHPVPDLLNWLGFSMATKKFEMSTRASLE